MITFRWFGPRDPIPLEYIRQIPAVRGIVGALFDIPVGEVWPLDRISALRENVEKHGMSLAVIESIPVHEDIKLGQPTRDRFIGNYCESIGNLGRAGVPVLCYNFMPVFDWMRTNLALRLDDGSTALAFDDAALAKIDLSRGTADLPGWATAYSADELGKLLAAYRSVSESKLWDNFAYFLERVVPVAAVLGRSDGAASGRSAVVDLWTAANHHQRCGARARDLHCRQRSERHHLLRRISRRRSSQ